MAANELLSGSEIGRCPHRVALERGGHQVRNEVEIDETYQRRIREAERVADGIRQSITSNYPDAVAVTSYAETREALAAGTEVIIAPRLPDDTVNKRRAHADVLVRTGRTESGFRYVPILIRNIEVTDAAATRRIRAGKLDALRPSDSTWTEGMTSRRSDTITRAGLSLCHTYRTLDALGFADSERVGGIIDRNGSLWWLELESENVGWNLTTYDEAFRERREVLDAQQAWVNGGTYPTTPFWHRECDNCPFSNSCSEILTASEDISLVRFTKFSEQIILRESGITTWRQLALLDSARAAAAYNSVLSATAPHDPVEYLGKQFSQLPDLIFKARAMWRGGPLRRVSPEQMQCTTADVEVDVDMESYNDHTYLWGATVRTRTPIDGVTDGYYSFVEWGELTSEAESRIFAEFWTWFSGLQRDCETKGLTFAAYCFYEQAENGAMRRAVSLTPAITPPWNEVSNFLTSPKWVDLHNTAKECIQTEGPLGLKVLAPYAGFHWRDEAPGGEASMVWYETATASSDETALASRQRILEYNEDDCHATRYLRDWINTEAKLLPSRDETPAAQ